MLHLQSRGLLTCKRLYPHRLYSTQQLLSPQHSVYISNSTNPYFNLSLEDWLFRAKNPKEPLLLLYRDSPCVVIGRNQNPWKEVNLYESRQKGIPWIRRRSGGGTVYHDLGNTNFSIHLPRSSFDRRTTAKTILSALDALGISAYANDRGDVCVAGEKVSGSAYKIVNSRAYHHGTMLIRSDLGSLGGLLRVDNKETMHTKGVASVRSPVANLTEVKPDLTHDMFVKAAIKAFRLDYDIDVDDKVHYVDEEIGMTVDAICRGVEDLKKWDWAYGQTPEFTYTSQQTFNWGTVNARLRSKHGVILDFELHYSNGAEAWAAELSNWSGSLKGKRYGFVADDLRLQGVLGVSDGPELRALRTWLADMLWEW